MLKAKSYTDSRELLFLRLMQVGIFAISLVCIVNFFSKNFGELKLSGGFLILFAINLLVFSKLSKSAAYHLMLWSFILLIFYPVFVEGKSYYAIIIYPVAALIYNIVFFDDKRIRWLYFVLLIVLEFILLASTMEISLPNITVQFIAEYINSLAYMMCVFFIAQFFFTNLQKHQSELSFAKADIKEKREELEEKNNVLDKYIESNIQLESFAHMAAHELKAPLRSITGFASLLRKKIQGKLTEDEDKMFEIISSSNRKMHDMVGALNQLGSVSKMKLNPTEFSIAEMVDEILFDRKEDIAQKGAEIKCDFEIPFIFGDRTLLKQLLSNLIGNALKFVKEDISPQIRIGVYQQSKTVKIIVSDNGIGISQEHRDKIFTLFERLNNNSEYAGSGIGLAIGKKIVDLHKGRIWVEDGEDGEDGGSAFHIELAI